MKLKLPRVGANVSMRKVLIDVFGLYEGYTPYPITDYTNEQMLKVSKAADSVGLIHHYDEKKRVSIGFRFGDHTIAFLLKEVISAKK